MDIDSHGDLSAAGGLSVVPTSNVDQIAAGIDAIVLGPARQGTEFVVPHARAVAHVTKLIASTAPADLALWEPQYGRLAEAQVKWEADNGRLLHAH